HARVADGQEPDPGVRHHRGGLEDGVLVRQPLQVLVHDVRTFHGRTSRRGLTASPVPPPRRGPITRHARPPPAGGLKASPGPPPRRGPIPRHARPTRADFAPPSRAGRNSCTLLSPPSPACVRLRERA